MRSDSAWQRQGQRTPTHRPAIRAQRRWTDSASRLKLVWRWRQARTVWTELVARPLRLIRR